MDKTVTLINKLIVTADQLEIEREEFRRSINLGTREEWEAYEMLESAIARLRGAASCLFEHEERCVTR